jgi:hypothetical protein
MRKSAKCLIFLTNTDPGNACRRDSVPAMPHQVRRVVRRPFGTEYGSLVPINHLQLSHQCHACISTESWNRDLPVAHEKVIIACGRLEVQLQVVGFAKMSPPTFLYQDRSIRKYKRRVYITPSSVTFCKAVGLFPRGSFKSKSTCKRGVAFS